MGGIGAGGMDLPLEADKECGSSTSKQVISDIPVSGLCALNLLFAASKPPGKQKFSAQIQHLIPAMLFKGLG